MVNTLLCIMEKRITSGKPVQIGGRVKEVLISQMFEINEIENVKKKGKKKKKDNAHTAQQRTLECRPGLGGLNQVYGSNRPTPSV